MRVFRPEFGDFRPEFGDLRPEFGDFRPEFGDFRPEFGDFRPELELAAFTSEVDRGIRLFIEVTRGMRT